MLIEAGSNLQNSAVDLIIHGKADSKIAAMTLEGALARTANRVPRIVVPATWAGFRLASKTTAGLNYERANRGDSEAGSLSRFLKESSGEFVLAMSADIAIDTDGWMEVLLLAAQERDVAVVCAAVLSEDGTIEHAG